MRKGVSIRPVNIMPVEAPGHLDLQALQNWAVRMASEAGGEMARRMGMGTRRIKCTASVVADAEQWQHSPDATWLTVHWGPVTGCIAIPMPLAVSTVVRALGYDGHSELPLGPVDLQVLIGCLQPGVTLLQDRAGLPGPVRIEAGHSSDGWPGEGPLVLLSFSMETDAVGGTWQLAVPWAALTETVRNSPLPHRASSRMGLDALQDVPVRADVVIDGGKLPVTQSMKLNKGDVITLDSDLTDLIYLRVAGRQIGRGRLGSSGGRWALRVSEMHWATPGFSIEEQRHE